MKKYININLLFIVLAAMLSGCLKSDFESYDFVDNAFDVKGAIVSVDEVGQGFYNLNDINSAFVDFSISTKGESASEVKVYKSFNGGDKVLHTTVNPPATLNIPIDAAIEGLGVAKDDLAVGDVISYSFEPVTASGSNLSGATFDAVLSCPSTLAGTYMGETSGQSTDDCCPGTVSASKEVTLTDDGNGNYTISDFSAGLYFEWYEVYGITADYDLSGGITDVCSKISGEFPEPFGTNVTITSGSVDPSTGAITYTWVNGYDDTATVTLTPK